MKLSIIIFTTLLLYSNSTYAKSINIGVPNIPPFAINAMEGTQVEWWKEVARRSNLEINIQVFPLARLRRSLENNIIDLAIYGKGTTEKKSVVNLMEHQKVNFVIYYIDHKKSKLSEVKGIVVGGIIGASNFDELDQKFGLKVVKVVSYSALINMYLKERIDAMYGIQFILEYFYNNQVNSTSFLPQAVPVKSIKNIVRASSVFFNNHSEIIKKIKTVANDMVTEKWQTTIYKNLRTQVNSRAVNFVNCCANKTSHY